MGASNKLWSNGIFRYRPSRGTADQLEYKSNFKTVGVFGINSSREWLI
jgi:hypothetical protein